MTTVHGTGDTGAIDLLDQEFLADPYAVYRRLRDEAPVFLGQLGFWMVSRYDDVLAIVRDTDRFSSAGNGGGSFRKATPELLEVLKDAEPQVDTLLTADPPVHTRYRNLVNKAFTPKRVAQIEGEIRQITDELIDAFHARGSVELVTEFAVGLPLTVIADALGVDRADMPLFKKWSDDSVAPLSGLLTDEQRVECAKSQVALQQYMKARIAERRIEPRDDLLSDLVTARITDDEGEHELDDAELCSIIQQLLVAGNETTTKLIAALTLELTKRPELQELLRAEPERISNAVEEALRYEAPVQNLFRVAKVDVELHGVQIPAGSRLCVMYGSASRDERRYGENACTFDPDRADARTHLAFSQGIHFCVGAALARSEARIGMERLLARLGDIAVDPERPPHYELGFVLRGMKTLHLTFTPLHPEADAA
jgi:cytochrome P450